MAAVTHPQPLALCPVMDGWVAICAIASAVLQLPLLLVTVLGNTGVIDGGSPDSEYGPDRWTDRAAIVAGFGLMFAIAAAVLALL